MITLRPSHERGHANHGWLDTYHTFSFADYYDPRNMGFASLRVINDDRVAPAMGFGAHPHRDMEIITVILEGALEHQDSMGNRAIIRPNEVQRMSAGTGVTHSEVNPSASEPVHLLQIWIVPNQLGVTPSYEQTLFPESEKLNQLRLVASPDGHAGSVTIHQDARLYMSVIEGGARLAHPLAPGRKAFLHVARGTARLNGQPLGAGDGARIEQEGTIELTAEDRAEILLFDLA